MSEAQREQILEAVARGEVTPDEANALLKALNKPRPALWRWLFFPMEVLGTRTALLIGLVTAVGALTLSRFDVRFAGAISARHVAQDVPWHLALADLFVSWPLTALVFWLAAKLAGRRGRYLDQLAQVGVARLPLVTSMAVMVAFFVGHIPRDPVEATKMPALAWALVAGLVVGLPALAWFITLLVTGFRSVTGLRGGRLALTFIAALIVAEVIAMVLLLPIPR